MIILLLEDEPAIREAEAAYLKQAGYTVVEASNGRDALSLFKAHGADLAILDINVPGLTGLEVCRGIRQTSTIPILIVTARNNDEDEVVGLHAGADDYIRKPFNPSVLIARVEALLRRVGKGRLQYVGLGIDPETAQVVKDGRRIDLTTTQFNILFELASRPGVVLSRDQLIDRIYADPMGHAIYDRTIDAHIKSLRKHIEDDPAKPVYIQTVIGRGYRFNGVDHV